MTLPVDIHTHRLPAVPGMAIVNRYPDMFHADEDGYFSVGIHPWYLGMPEGQETTQALLEVAVNLPQVLAVGEAGLDRLARAPMAWQMEAFAYQARLAMIVEKPLVIHLVKAVDELLRLRHQLRPANPWIIHGFRGNATQANGLLRQGLYLSFGERYHQEALQVTPIDRLFVETDESLLSVDTLYERAAFLRQIPVEALRQSVGENVARLFFKS